MTPADADHRCVYREENERLQALLAELQAKLLVVEHELATLQRRVLGPTSEKMTSIQDELRRRGHVPRSPESAKEKRRERAQAKEALERRESFHRVADDKRCCPRCGRDDLKPLGEGRRTTEYHYIPARFIRVDHIQETLACVCGEYVVTAESPPKVVEGGRYGAGFLAHLVTAKCGDSIPIYRLEKEYKRLGIPIARSTMTDLFHRAAELTQPISERLLELIASQPIVGADETSIRVQEKKKCRRAFIWTFVADSLIAYRFSANRSGETPREVLGGTQGTLVVDAYTGYNPVTEVDGRLRAGCLAHVRRKFFDSIPTAPEAKDALEIIVDLYRVEHEARERGIVRTPEHQKLRHLQSRPIMNRLKEWLDAQKPLHLPKSPIATAISYTLNNWEELSRFLDDVRVPLDNNASEAALRVVALGRKNFLFLGHDQAGRNIAGLYSLVATCEANGVNPVDYLTDVLIRVQTHPASRLDELLPQNWKRLVRDLGSAPDRPG